MTAHKRQAGYTFVEMAVTLTVSLIVFALLFWSTGGLMKLSSTSLAVGGLEEAAGRVTSMVASELRWADPETLLLTAENGSSRIDCSLATGYDGIDATWTTPVTYRYEPAATDINGNGVIDEGRIVRIQDGRERTLCRNVVDGGLVFTVENETIVVQVTVFGKDSQGREYQAVARTAAHLMNRTAW